MARFKKALLKCGTYHSPDGKIEVTPERLKHFADTFAKMSAADLGIPVGYDHSDDPAKTVPLSLAALKGPAPRSAKDSVGWLDQINLSPDGQSLEFTLEIPDEAAAKKAETNVVEVSPIIYPAWKDGQGREWRDCITHVDLVNHPVDAGQTPFTPVPAPASIACGLRMSLVGGASKMYRLADGDSEKRDPQNVDSPLPKVDDNPDLPGPPKSDEGKKLEAILAYLEQVGVVLPSDTDATNFMERLLTGLMSAQAAKDQAKAESEKAEKEDDDMPNPSEASPQFAAMSLKANVAHSYAERAYKKEIASRLQAAFESGRCTSDEHNAHKQALDAVKLSLGTDEVPHKSQVELWLESRESLPEGAAWKHDQRLRMAAEAPAPNINGEISDEEASKILDDVFRRNKGHKAAAS